MRHSSLEDSGLRLKQHSRGLGRSSILTPIDQHRSRFPLLGAESHEPKGALPHIPGGLRCT